MFVFARESEKERLRMTLVDDFEIASSSGSEVWAENLVKHLSVIFACLIPRFAVGWCFPFLSAWYISNRIP